MRVLFLVTVSLFQGGPAPRADTLVKVWDVADPSARVVQLPVRVQSPGGVHTRVFAADGSTAWEGSLCGPEPAPGALRPWADPDSTLGEPYRGLGCGVVWFSRDGRLAVVQDQSVRDGPWPYIRPFDPGTGRFALGRSYTPPGGSWKWALGDSQVACFIEVGKRHVMEWPQRLRLVIVGRKAGNLHVEPVWEDSSYVGIGSADMNDAGDVVAVVGKPATNPLPRSRAGESWGLLVAPKFTRPVVRELEGAERESKVAVSRDGRWIALSVGNSGTIRAIDSRTFLAADVHLTQNDVVRDARLVSVIRLAIADDRAIAATAFVCREPGSCETHLFFLRPGGAPEVVRSYGPSWIDVELHFFAGNRLYVAHAGRPGLVELGVGGAVERRSAPVESAACVYEY